MADFQEKIGTDGSEIDYDALKKATHEQLAGGGLKGILSKFKDPENHVIEDTVSLLNVDQNLRRNAANIARDSEIKNQVNNSSNSEKKKMLALKCSMAVSASRKGEIQGVAIAIKGGMASISYKSEILIRDKKYSKLLFKSEDNLSFVIFFNSSILSGTNRIISDYTGVNIFGPVMVFSYDEKTENLASLAAKTIKTCFENFKTTRNRPTFIKKIETPESD